MSTPHADPKGPLLPDDAGVAKKASKKSSSKRSAGEGSAAGPSSSPAPATSQLSTAAPPTSPVPALHDVPRLAIAEPKGGSVEGGEVGERTAKARPAKKRTSTPEAASGVAPAGPSLPTAPVASDATTAVAKSEADAEKERARREAKRQKQRELEEQRKREELERQAAEETRKKEELRRQLNANADVVQEEEAGDGYGDEGFEDYADDFDNDDAPPPQTARPKAPVTAKPLAKAKGMPRDANQPSVDVDPAELRRIQEAQKAESKELASAAPRPAAKATKSTPIRGTGEAPAPKGEAKKSSPASSIAASIAGLKQTLDPRARRVKEIRELRRLDVEKFNVFVQSPLAEGDIYMGRLLRGSVRQVAIQTKDDDKSVSTQTKVPAMMDKSMHFPDDVGIDEVSSTKLTARVKRNKTTDNQADNDSEGALEGEEENDESASTVSSMRFLSFLDQSSQVCELLIEENIQEAEAQHMMQTTTKSSDDKLARLTRDTALSSAQLFPCKRFDNPGLEKLLKGRPLTALQFSPAVSNILVAWYAPVISEHCERHENHEEEKKETNNDSEKSNNSASVHALDSVSDKSIGCVWDINQLDQVLYAIKSESLVISSSLAPTRDLMGLAGTEDGSINVWDLRSRFGLVGGRRSAEYGLEIFSPTYSTSGADSRSKEGSHFSSIVAIEAVDRNDGGVFQFGSLDDRGVLVIWSVVDYSDERDAETLLSDKCLTIGGRIKLVVSVVLDTQRPYLELTRPGVRAYRRREQRKTMLNKNKASSYSSSYKKIKHDPLDLELKVGPIATVLRFFLNDPNQFLVGTSSGLVLRGSRYDNNAAFPDDQQVPLSSVQCYRRDRLHAVDPPTPVGIAVTCIAFHPTEADFFLVGYEDGRICLFDAAITSAVSTWEEVDFDKSVTALQWSPSRPGVFFASYSHGVVHAWDLTALRHTPAFEHKLLARKDVPTTSYPLSLSSEKMRTSRPSIAVCCGGEEPFGFQVHELGAEFTTSARGEAEEVKQILSAMF